MAAGSKTTMVITKGSAGQDFDYWSWSDSFEKTNVHFVGRGPKGTREEILQSTATLGPTLAVSQLRQVHSNSIVLAVEGDAGPGDGLLSDQTSLALSIATADCVPVLLASGERIAAIHAGWRGIAAGIVSKVGGLMVRPYQTAIAWIGPSIGPCCYEVGPEVAAGIVPGTDSHQRTTPLVSATASGKYKLDLRKIVADQLNSAGILDLRHISICTQCNPSLLWSYRAEKSTPGGRNLAFIWRDE